MAEDEHDCGFCGEDEDSDDVDVDSIVKDIRDSSLPMPRADTDVADSSIVPETRITSSKPCTPKINLLVTGCILLTELCERLTYYGIAANLVLFCNFKLGWSTSFSTSISLAFTGTCYFIPLFGGWLADSYTGRYNTIYGSLLIYTVGVALLLPVSFEFEEYQDKSAAVQDMYNEPWRTSRIVFFALSLFLIATGTGGIKANVSPFGADQVRHAGNLAIQRFFNWFYWFINVGSFVSFTAVVYIQQNGVGDNGLNGFFYGYLIPFVAIFFAIVTLVIARNQYIAHPPSGSSIFADVAKIVCYRVKRWKRKDIDVSSSANHCLDHAMSSHGGPYTDEEVEDVKKLFRILPVFICLIFYWTIYFQMQTSFLIQGEHMDLQFSNTFVFPAASLSIFDILAVLLLIPFMDNVVYPILRYFNINLSMLKRMGIGMLFASASVFVAGVIENERLDKEKYGVHNQTLAGLSDKPLLASNMTIFYQVPQFLLIGTSEVFTSITGLEFAYSQAPRNLQGVIMGLFLVTSGLGNYVGGMLVSIVNAATKSETDTGWFPETNDFQAGHLQSYFYLLGIIMLVNFLFFLIIAARYTYVSSDDDKIVQEKSEERKSKVNSGRFGNSGSHKKRSYEEA